MKFENLRAIHSLKIDVQFRLLIIPRLPHSFEWTNRIRDKTLKNEIVKIITTALKSNLKLERWKSLVAKCCCKSEKLQVLYTFEFSGQYLHEVNGSSSIYTFLI